MSAILRTLSHDSVNRFLSRERFQPKDLFDFLVENGCIELSGGVVSADDTLLEKPYSNRHSCPLLGYYWSGKHHKTVLGIPLVSLYYTSPNGVTVPINYRIYDKQEGKTKNQYLRDMIREVYSWGLRPAAFTSDTWYAAKETLILLTNEKLRFLVGAAKNRQVRLKGGSYQAIEKLSIPEQGLWVHLRGVGQVKAFCQRDKNGRCRYYLLYCPNSEEPVKVGRKDFEHLHKIHWGIECFHRACKQLCGLQRFRVRSTAAIRTHVFCALRGFIELELNVWRQQLGNWYGLQRELYQEVARQYILKEPLLSNFS